MNSELLFIVVIFAVWRLSSLLSVNHAEAGPFNVFNRIRDRAGVKFDEYSRPYGKSQIAQILACIWCTSVWVAFPAAIWLTILWDLNLLHGFALWLAISTGAIVVDGVTK